MHNITKVYDFSTWTGNWPFIDLRYKDMNTLKQKLKSENIIKAFISPIEGILEQDPMRADNKLLSDIKDDFFSPVPIVDLSFVNWEEVMNSAIDDGRVKILKLLPNYHMYEINEKILQRLVEIAQKHKLIISIQMRVEDARHQYPLMKVPDMDVINVVKTLSYYPEQAFILNNIYIQDLVQVLQTLDNVYVDTACLEIQDVIEVIHQRFGLDRLLFSSHCPFYFLEGNLHKLKYASVNIDEVEKVAYKNAELLLGLKKE